jgi:hypothetical protein
MKRIPLIAAVIWGIGLTCFHTGLRAATTDTEYPKEWKQVDSLEKAGLPKSALEIVNRISRMAKDDQNDPQYVKSVIFRMKLGSEYMENFDMEAVKMLRTEVATSAGISQAIFRSLLGEVICSYYSRNSWKFSNRTQSSSVPDSDFSTWDLKRLSLEATRQYLRSLQDPQLLKPVPAGEFSAILLSHSVEEKNPDIDPTLRPTLYDILLQRALAYFTSTEMPGIKAASAFRMYSKNWFGLPAAFVAITFPPADTFSSAWFALKLHQDAASFHLKDKDPRILIDYELDRLSYVWQNAAIQGRDSLYREALKAFESAYIGFAASSSVSFALAQFLDQQGQLYEPLESAKHKWDRKEAIEICGKAAARYPGTAGGKNCLELEKQIREPSLQVTMEYAVYPDRPSPASFRFRNLTSASFRIVSMDPEGFAEKAGRLNREELLKYLGSLYYLKAWTLTLPTDGDLQSHTTEISVPEVPAGYYVLICSPDKEFQDQKAGFGYAGFWATRISYISRQNEHGGIEYFVLDRESGQPLKNVAVEVFSRSYNYLTRAWANNKTGDYTTDEGGYFALPPPAKQGPQQNSFLKLRIKSDVFSTGNFYMYPREAQKERSLVQTNFYLDRGIYRPGQPIYFKGIILEKTGSKYTLKTGFKTTVTFRDVNAQKIGDLTLTSNEFGSVNGSFIAPGGVLAGLMTISNESGSIGVQVEEYRRPTFEVTFLPVEGNYKLGQLVTVKGKAEAFAGNHLGGATVTFRVVRAARFPWLEGWWRKPFPVSPDLEVSGGTLTTDSTGEFSVRFNAIPDDNVAAGDEPVFDFTVYADVTDLNGETQSSSTSVSAGYKSLLIGLTIPDKLNLRTDSLVRITTTNLSGRATPVTVSIRIQKLRQPDRIFTSRLWERPDLNTLTKDELHKSFPNQAYGDEDNPETWPVAGEVLVRTLNTATDSILNIRHPSSGIREQGTYRLTLTATDPFGQAVEKKTYFTAFDPNSKEMPVKALNWFVPLTTSSEPGKKAQFLIGSSGDDMNLMYEVRMHDSLVSRQWLTLTNRQMLAEVSVDEAYRGNFSVSFTFIDHNRVFNDNTVVQVPYSDKKLNLSVSTFRDKLLPGQQEEWRIRITGPKGKPADAEFLASMHDASLDLFRPNDWSFDLYQQYFYFLPWQGDDNFRVSPGTVYPMVRKSSGFIMSQPDRINWFGLWFGFSMPVGGIYKTRGPGQADHMLPMAAMTEEENKKEAPVPAMDQSTQASSAPVQKPATPTPTIQIRKDFRETVFFYPSLVTDSSGSLYIKFTMPEALTRWKFQGLAYTKNLEYGMITKELVTRKDLMVFPNLPRFVRDGDTLRFSVKIVNLSGRDLSGQLTVDLSNAITSAPVDTLLGNLTRQRAFTIRGGESIEAGFTLVIPPAGSLSVLKYRVMAVAGSFSDGEEKAIPVLPNRMMVTESLPLSVRGKGTTVFTMARMEEALIQPSEKRTLTNYRLSLEFASNPVWYAVQALPALNEVTYHSADQVFEAFYSNSLASYILNSDPKIRQVFESWQRLTPDALLSNLEKNQDLKTALLAETPWVLESQNETRNKQRLGLYFNPDNLGNNLNVNLGLLKKMQTPGGGWPWFEGMPESRWVTQQIVLGLGRLVHLGVLKTDTDPETKAMLEQAIAYLDHELIGDYNDIKVHYPGTMKENHLSATEIQYLYAISLFPASSVVRPPTSGYDEALAYFYSQASVYWLLQDLPLQAMIALALTRNGDTKVPGAILSSLSEKALHSGELGMYWAMDAGYSWFQLPVETQAVLIEAYDEISGDQNLVDEMKVWLLKQKQTRMWATNHATADACYALLLRGTGQLSDDPGLKITVGKEQVDPGSQEGTHAEAGTGYFRVSWSGKEITPAMARITVTKNSEGVAWGSLYWQYFENLDKITVQESPLNVTKEVFVERNSDSGPVLDKIRDGGSIRVGDKVKVRIVLRVDRDMEFVQLKDMRGAGFEPSATLSGYQYQGGLGYYQATGDLATSFFFDYLPKGLWVFEYPLRANASGEFSNGIATAQCLYAPEFSAHSEGIRLTIRN